MKIETKKEMLTNWYSWLERRIGKQNSAQEFYIKQVLEGVYEQTSTSNFIGPDEKEAIKIDVSHVLNLVALSEKNRATRVKLLAALDNYNPEPNMTTGDALNSIISYLDKVYGERDSNIAVAGEIITLLRNYKK